MSAVQLASPVLAYVIAFGFGALIGVSELISRYKDAPLIAIRTPPAVLYLAVNAMASLGALYLIRTMGWMDQAGPTPDKTLVLQTLTASFGAMAFFRSSLFTIRIGNADVQVGPAGFLQVILSSADRACDRSRAKPRAQAVAEIMNNISFAKAQYALPSLCFGLMQNVSSDEQRALGLVVKDLLNTEMDDVIKANNLGLALMNIVGEGVLREAVAVLRRLISAPPKQVVQSILTLQLLKPIDFNVYANQLIDECLLISGQLGSVRYRTSLLSQVAAIRKMDLQPVQKTLLLSALIISEFSEEILQAVLKSLKENQQVTTAPPQPPSQSAAAPAVAQPPAQAPVQAAAKSGP
ncbi:MAG TPA: hypothetical protein VN814_24325 [Caulobacteraceae bacterium]|nr:hypothetical protein [Caulobacteraceae bacterium]